MSVRKKNSRAVKFPKQGNIQRTALIWRRTNRLFRAVKQTFGS